MIREWWKKVGSRFRGNKGSNAVGIQDQAAVGRDSNAVVPLRKNPDTAVIRKKDNAELFTDAMDRLPADSIAEKYDGPLCISFIG